MGYTGEEVPKREIETDYGNVTLYLQSRDRVTVTAGTQRYEEGRAVYDDTLSINRVEYVARFDIETESSYLDYAEFVSSVNGSIGSGANPLGSVTRPHRVSPIWPSWMIDFDQSWHGLRRVDGGGEASDSAREILTTDLLDSIAIKLQGMGDDLDRAEILGRERLHKRVESEIDSLLSLVDLYRGAQEMTAAGVLLRGVDRYVSELRDNPRDWLLDSMRGRLKK